MSWWATGITAAVGVLNGAANQKKMDRQNAYRAEAIRYSPWTGMGDPGELQLPGALESGLQGAALGAQAGSAMSKSSSKIEPQAGVQTSTLQNGNGAGQLPMTPEQQKWMLMNQSQGGPGYTVVG